jgi:hypothetical protein
MCILDPNAIVVDCNGATLRMLQCRTRNEMIGQCLFDFLATEEGLSYICCWHEFVRAQEAWRYVQVFRTFLQVTLVVSSYSYLVLQLYGDGGGLKVPGFELKQKWLLSDNK